MATVELPTAKASVSDTPGGLVIKIPARRSWVLILFVGLWLCGWVAGGSYQIYLLTSGKTQESGILSILGWLGMWTILGCSAIFFWIWIVAGHEIVTLTPTYLSIRREILGFGWSANYDLVSVKNLLVNRAPNSSWTGGSRPRSMFGGSIAFDYVSKTLRFGGGLDEAEASHLIELLKSRYPFDYAAV
jgi:hypothetical protein